MHVSTDSHVKVVSELSVSRSGKVGLVEKGFPKIF
jgi:hypothetical protein